MNVFLAMQIIQAERERKKKMSTPTVTKGDGSEKTSEDDTNKDDVQQ